MSAHPPADSTGRTPLEQFLDVIAHEVRAPLSIARMAAETVSQADIEEAERRRLLEMIVRNTDLALMLLDRMGLARDVEAGTVHLRREEVDLGQLVRQTIDDVRSVVLARHPVRVRGPNSAPVSADATALREILLNLLLNATKYSPPETPIEVSVGVADDQVTVVVEDHGPGVIPEDLERIFHQYVQVESGSCGVGLGLYISRGLARAHGGDLRARRDVEAGSQFELRLPRTAGPPVRA